MRIQINIEQLKLLLQNRGWEVFNSSDELFLNFENKLLFVNSVKLVIPTNTSAPDFPEQLKISLKRLCQIDPEIGKKHLIAQLYSQATNMSQKFKKNKKEWIFAEPKSKYEKSEIPDIYIPKKFYI
jgi:hypothetical protein